MTGTDGSWRRTAAMHQNILANLGDGVLAIDLSGQVITFNPAAGSILGLDHAQVIGCSFAEVFLMEPSLEPLSELILKAVYEAEITHNADIELDCGGETRSLSVSTTFLRTLPEDGGERVGVIAVLRDVTAERKRRQLKRLFGEYLDPRIVEQLIERTEVLEGGTRQPATVMFVDLEGFTSLAEDLDPPELMRFLNGFLALISQPIGGHAGVTDKYMGDAIMAFWGPPFTASDGHAQAACAAALEQRAMLPELRALLPAASRLDMRTGLAAGEVVAGSVGPAQARNYTVIGDTVNLAARLEVLNKSFGTRILVNRACRDQAGADFLFREIGMVRVRGRLRPEPVYELMAQAAHATADLQRLCACYEGALQHCRQRDWPRAVTAFDTCRELAPTDAPSTIMAARVRELQADPPDEAWDGVWS